MRLTAFPDAPSGQTEGEDEKQRLVRVRELLSGSTRQIFSAKPPEIKKSERKCHNLPFFFFLQFLSTIYRRVFCYGAL